LNIELLPPDWDETACNLENSGNVSLLKIDKSISGLMTCKSACGCFALTLNPAAADFTYKIFDFIEYENAHERRVLIFSPEFDMMAALANPPRAVKIRETDPEFVTHSTTLKAYRKILKDGCLKSTARLNREGTRQKAIGLTPLGEPRDYLEYVMFGRIGGEGGEVVVNSHLRGQVCYDPDAKYRPQARMYFDAHKIFADGLAVRDGAHELKVYDALKLSGYLLLTVRAGDAALPDGARYWTPKLFAREADKLFENHMRGSSRGQG